MMLSSRPPLPRAPRPSFRLWAVVFCALAPIALSSPTSGAAGGARFEAPASKTTVPGEEGRQTICTVWRDITVIERQDGPVSEAARLVRGGEVDCGKVRDDTGTALDTAGMALEGRVGPVLLFTAMDPHGAIDFAVVRARDGEVLMQEALIGSPSFASATVGGDGAVTLKYVRARNAPCSLRQDERGCWEKLVADGAIPGAMAKRALPKGACVGSYRKERAPDDDPSIVTWGQVTILAADGSITKSFSETIGCRPLP